MENNGFSIDKDLFSDEIGEENTQAKDTVPAFSAEDLPTKRYDDKSVKKKEKTDKKGKKGKKQSHGTVKSLVLVIFIIAVSLLIAGGVIYAGADYLGVGFGRGKPCVMNIEEGSSTAEIAAALKENGTVKVPLLFRLYSKLKHYDSLYKYGVFNFNNELGYEGIAYMLMEGGATADTKTVTIPEMSTIDDMAKILEKEGICAEDDFIDEVQNGSFDYPFLKDIPTNAVYYRLEGYLFPDTYNLYVCENSRDGAHLAINIMLSTLQNKIESLKDDIEKSDYSFHEIMTMASIVELESGGSPDEMAKVAAVFYNRLTSDEFTTLGSSPTKKYPHGNGRYDTYNCIGLPPGPLCSPSFNSIKAAVNPEKNFDYYYFVTDKSMNFYYRKTLREHNAIIEKLMAEDNWIYEYFE